MVLAADHLGVGVEVLALGVRGDRNAKREGRSGESGEFWEGSWVFWMGNRESPFCGKERLEAFFAIGTFCPVSESHIIKFLNLFTESNSTILGEIICCSNQSRYIPGYHMALKHS